MAALIAGAVPADGVTVFLHSGGLPSLFAKDL